MDQENDPPPPPPILYLSPEEYRAYYIKYLLDHGELGTEADIKELELLYSDWNSSDE